MSLVLFWVGVLAAAGCREENPAPVPENAAAAGSRAKKSTPAQIRGSINDYRVFDPAGMMMVAGSVVIGQSTLTLTISATSTTYAVLFTQTASVSSFFPRAGYPAGTLHVIMAEQPVDSSVLVFVVLQRSGRFYGCMAVYGLDSYSFNPALQNNTINQAVKNFSLPLTDPSNGCYDGENSPTSQDPRKGLPAVANTLDQNVIDASLPEVDNTAWYPYTP